MATVDPYETVPRRQHDGRIKQTKIVTKGTVRGWISRQLGLQGATLPMRTSAIFQRIESPSRAMYRTSMMLGTTTLLALTTASLKELRSYFPRRWLIIRGRPDQQSPIWLALMTPTENLDHVTDGQLSEHESFARIFNSMRPPHTPRTIPRCWICDHLGHAGCGICRRVMCNHHSRDECRVWGRVCTHCHQVGGPEAWRANRELTYV